MARVAVWGMWHLGSVVAAGLAALGHEVLATDLRPERVERLRSGAAPVHEPGLDELLAAQIGRGALEIAEPNDRRLGQAEVTILSADVDVDDEDVASPAELEGLAGAAAGLLGGETVLVVMSQVPVGTSHRLAEDMAARAGIPHVPVACMPENLRLGTALESFFEPDRLVLGADEEGVAEKVRSLFASIDCPVLTIGVRSAEMSKHALNAYLATCVSLSGEVSDLCERAGADASDVVAALRLDRRVSPHAPLAPGLGFAGGTLGRDVQYLRRAGRELEVPTPMMDAVLSANRRRLPALAERLGAISGGLQGAAVCLLGLTYKPGTDTLRRSQSVELGRLLAAAGARVTAHDPTVAAGQAAELGFSVFSDPYEAAAGADVVVLLTGWPEYRNLDPRRLASAMQGRDLVDPGVFLDWEGLRSAGIRTHAVGKPSR